MTVRDSAGAMRSVLGHMHTWQRSTVNRRILAAMVTVGGVTALTKAAALAKDVLTAAYFGTSDAMDAFLIAFVLPAFATNVIAGSLEAAVVPTYVRVRDRDGPDAAKRLLSSVLVTSTVLLAAVGVILLLAGPYLLPLIGATFAGEKLALTRHLFVLLIPGFVLSGAVIVLSSALNANERFLWSVTTPVIGSVVILLLLYGKGTEWGVAALAIGFVVGRFFEVLALAWRLVGLGLLDWRGWREWHPALGQVLKSFAPVAVGAAVMSNAPLVDQAMAATLGPGSVSTLMYAGKMVAAVLSVAAPAVATVIFPHFSRMVADEDWAAVRRTLRTYGRLVLGAGAAVAVGIIAFSTPIVRLFFERGEFSAADTQLVSQVQMLLALQIPFYLLSMVGVRLLTAMRGTQTVMWVSVASFGINVGGNLVGMRLWGLAGIALSTSVVYFVSMLLVFAAVFRRFNRFDRQAVPVAAVRCAT